MTHLRLPFFAAVSFGAVLSALAVVASPARAATCVNVEVQNLRAGGTLMVAAYADAETFGKSPVAALQMKVDGESMRFPVCGPQGDHVALTLYQDMNGNGQLDKNVLGIPSEPWGTSGRPAAMSAPTWATTVVPIDASTIVVRLSR